METKPTTPAPEVKAPAIIPPQPPKRSEPKFSIGDVVVCSLPPIHLIAKVGSLRWLVRSKDKAVGDWNYYLDTPALTSPVPESALTKK